MLPQSNNGCNRPATQNARNHTRGKNRSSNRFVKIDQTIDCKIDQAIDCKIDQTIDCKIDQAFDCKIDQTLEFLRSICENRFFDLTIEFILSFISRYFCRIWRSIWVWLHNHKTIMYAGIMMGHV